MPTAKTERPSSQRPSPVTLVPAGTSKSLAGIIKWLPSKDQTDPKIKLSLDEYAYNHPVVVLSPCQDAHGNVDILIVRKIIILFHEDVSNNAFALIGDFARGTRSYKSITDLCGSPQISSSHQTCQPASRQRNLAHACRPLPASTEEILRQNGPESLDPSGLVA